MLNTLSEIKFDSEGYMEDYKLWTKEIAQALADEEGIKLTERHFIVINYAREQFIKNGDAPTLRNITKHTPVGTKELYELFPDGPAKKAARIAGLKKPSGCI
jgi:TusE/DsrC/DsvC family sulfur relay protein